MMIAFVSLVFGTFISEDLACISAGLLIQRGVLSVWWGVFACALGIFVGDVALWGTGRICGRAILAWPWVAARVEGERTVELRAWLRRHAGGALVGSRFIPGTRLPLYLLSGMLRLPASVFTGWALVGTLLWTPMIVLSTAGLGDIVGRTERLGGLPSLVTAASVLLALQLVRMLTSRVRNFTKREQASGYIVPRPRPRSRPSRTQLRLEGRTRAPSGRVRRLPRAMSSEERGGVLAAEIAIQDR